MTPSVRILTLVYPDLPADRLAPEHPWQRFDALGQILRRHLPAATAAVFARPEPATDGTGAFTWTSELAGQPTPLLELPDAAQDAARRILTDHLNAITRLADELTRREPDDPEPARLLTRAILYPGDEAVYVIGGAPVLISWGGTDPGHLPDRLHGSGAAAAPMETAARRWPAWVLPVLGLIALLGLGLGAWLWLQQKTEETLREDLAAALANHCEPTAPLLELATRLARIDSAEERYADLRMAVLTEIGICEEADLFSQRLATDPPCAHLTTLDEELAFYDLGRAPFDALKADLDGRIAACTQVAGLAARLEAMSGDCAAVNGLSREAAALDEPKQALAALRLGLARAGDACALAERLDPRFTAADGDCAALRTLARDSAADLAALDSDRPPLIDLRQRLDAALERCDLADHLEGELSRSQDDCLVLAGLKETLQAADPQRPPLDVLSGRLAIALGQCADLSDLEQRFAEAQGDCTRLQALAGGLDAYRNNLRFLDIQTRLVPELAVCREASALEEQVAALGGDCTKAHALAATLADQGDPRFAAARDALKTPIADCDRIDRYAQRLEDAGTDCAALLGLEQDLKRESSALLRPTRQQLGQIIGPCRPPPPPPVVAQAAPQRPAPAIKPGSKPDSTLGSRPEVAAAPQGSGSFPMRGECSGRLTIDPTSGWDGDRVRHIVTIDPPASERVARVTSTNIGCRNCALRKIGRNTWRGDLYYGCGGRGIVEVSYAAYDSAGRVICKGNGSDLCLGRKGGGSGPSLPGLLRGLFSAAQGLQ